MSGHGHGLLGGFKLETSQVLNKLFQLNKWKGPNLERGAKVGNLTTHVGNINIS